MKGDRAPNCSCSVKYAAATSFARAQSYFCAALAMRSTTCQSLIVRGGLGRLYISPKRSLSVAASSSRVISGASLPTASSSSTSASSESALECTFRLTSWILKRVTGWREAPCPASLERKRMLADSELKSAAIATGSCSWTFPPPPLPPPEEMLLLPPDETLPALRLLLLPPDRPPELPPRLLELPPPMLPELPPRLLLLLLLPPPMPPWYWP